jgi:hypothetical protein
MNQPDKWRTIRTIAVLVVVVCVAGFFWSRHATTTAALAELQRQCNDLRSQVEARDQTLAELRLAIERAQSFTPAASPAERNVRSTPPMDANPEFARRLAELTVVQSNTLALVERLMDRATAAQAAESPQQRQAGLAALELSVTEFQQKVDTARQRTADLLVGLNIPPEISTMEPSKALATASLKSYWPFFDALREREHLIFLMEKLQARLLQEQLDARAAAEKAKAQ